MASSALEALVACARAIQDGDLKLADSLLERICNLAAGEPDEDQSKLGRYFVEALVRRAYGLHPAATNFTLQLTPSLFCLYHWYACNGSVKDAINKAVMGKKRFHLIDFYIPHLHGIEYLFWGLPKRSDNPLSVRVSVILPPFLKKIVNLRQEKQRLTTAAKIVGVELEALKVIYAYSLGEVDASMLEFRRTEDEAVVVCYFYKLQTLLAAAGVMEREFLKLRLINPDTVLVMEQMLTSTTPISSNGWRNLFNINLNFLISKN